MWGGQFWALSLTPLPGAQAWLVVYWHHLVVAMGQASHPQREESGWRVCMCWGGGGARRHRCKSPPPLLPPKAIRVSVALLNSSSMWELGWGRVLLSDLQAYPGHSLLTPFLGFPVPLQPLPNGPVLQLNRELFLGQVILRAHLQAFAQAVPSIWNAFPCCIPSISLSLPAGLGVDASSRAPT